MRPKPINLNQLIQDVVELHKHRTLEIDLDLAADLPEITADPDRLRQVLNNLVVNARDAAPENETPQIAIGTRRAGDDSYVELLFSDDGPGFPQDILAHVFEPYVTTKDKGTGLGLAIVKRIVEEHGGSIWAENPVAGGARITVQLPVSLASRPGLPQPRPNVARAQTG